MENTYKYKAFISYRHKAPDKAVAARLQKKLESYKPPKTIVGKGFKKWRLFRDETELRSGSDLNEDIKEALKDSEFLIVVCSDNTKESKWCMDEISYFKELHNGNNDKIITLVASGKPEEVIPSILCTQKVAVTDAFGNVVVEDQAIEPLAANITDEKGQASFSKLNEEYLRIAAVLLDCDYDDLYKRNQKRFIKKVIIIGSAILAVLLAFGIFATAMMINLNREKKRAENAEQEAIEQRDLAEQRLLEVNAEKERADANFAEAEARRIEADANFAEAEAQKRIADENYKNAKEQKRIADENYENAKKQKQIADENANEAKKQKNEAEKNMKTAQENEQKANTANKNLSQKSSDVLVREAKTLLADGRRVEAVQSAIEAINMQKTAGIPVSGESQRILSDVICAYEDYNFTNKRSVNLAGWLDGLLYIPDSEYFIAYSGKQVYLIDIKNGNLLKTKNFEYSINKIYLAENSVYVLSDESEIFALDYETLNLKWEYTENKKYNTSNILVFSPDGKTICLSSGNSVRFFSDNGEKIGKYEENSFGDNRIETDTMVLSNNGFLYTTNPNYEDVEKQTVYMLDIYAGQYYWYTIDKMDNISSLYCDDEHLFINFTEGEEGYLLCKNRADFTTKWEAKYENGGGISPHNFHTTVLHNKDGVNYIIAIMENIVVSVNRDTGAVITNYSIKDDAEEFLMADGYNVYVRTNKGYIACRVDMAHSYTEYNFDDDLIDHLIISNKYNTVVVGKTTSSELLIFNDMYQKNEYSEIIIPEEAEKYTQTDSSADNGNGIIATIKEKQTNRENKKIYIYDVKNKKPIQTIDFISKEDCFLEFYDKDKLLVWNKFNVYLYNINGEPLSSLSLNEHTKYGAEQKYALYKNTLILGSLLENLVIKITDNNLIFDGFIGNGDFDVNKSGDGVFVKKDKENLYSVGFGKINEKLTYITDNGKEVKFPYKNMGVSISDKGNLIAFVFYNESLNIYDKNKKTLKTLKFDDPEKKPDEIVITPDEKYIIVLSSDYTTLKKYSVEDLSLEGTMTLKNIFISLTQMKFISENDLLLTDPGNIEIVDISTMSTRASLPDGGLFVESENIVIEHHYTGNIKMYKYLTIDELLEKAEEFLNTYAS